MCQGILECEVLVGTRSAEGIMASGHVNRIKRPNTWLHRPMLQNVKKVLANPKPSTHDPFRKSGSQFCCAAQRELPMIVSLHDGVGRGASRGEAHNYSMEVRSDPFESAKSHFFDTSSWGEFCDVTLTLKQAWQPDRG